VFTRRRSRVVYWKQYDLVYIRVPKCGNRSIRKAIPDPEYHRVDLTRLAKVLPGSTSFSFVRNPWARLVSTWTNKIGDPGTNRETMIDGVHRGFVEKHLPMRGGMPFDEFAEVACAFPDAKTEKHLRSQSSFLVRGGEVIPDFLGRVETMAADWERLAVRTGVTERVGHLNNSRSKAPYAERYDARLRELVRDRYAEDIETFGYAFDT
jgi:dermatan 4-sulfotransferase 1